MVFNFETEISFFAPGFDNFILRFVFADRDIIWGYSERFLLTYKNPPGVFRVYFLLILMLI